MATRKVLVLVSGVPTELPLADAGDFGYSTHTHKNSLINCEFRIWQRGASFSPTALGKTYTADRWCYFNAASPANLTVSRQAFATGQSEVPNNPAYFVRALQGGSGSSSSHWLEQRVEDVRNLSGLDVVLSFWAKADAARTLPTRFVQNFGTGGTPSAEVSTGAQNNSLTTTWTKFTHQLTLPSLSGKTIGGNENSYLSVLLSFPLSTTFTIDLANVQLELGKNATDLERRLLSHDMDLCQRYFQRAGRWAPFVFHSATAGTGHLALATEMRATPSVGLTTTSPIVTVPGINAYTAASSTVGLGAGANGSKAQFDFTLTGFTGATVSKPAFVNEDYFMLDAEL